jgi:hypothetical protein
MVMATLVIRFIVEIVGIAALGYWGLQTSTDGFGRIVLAIAAPLALLVVWTMIAAPRASNALTQPQRDLIGTALLLLAAVALAMAGQPTLALVFAAVVVIDHLVMVAVGPAAVEAVRQSAARVR